MRNHLQKAHDRWALEPDRGAKTGFNDGSRRLSIDGDGVGPVGSLGLVKVPW